MEDKKLSADEVAKLLSVSRTTLWRYVKSGTFPEPEKSKLNGYSIYWLQSVVTEKMAELK